MPTRMIMRMLTIALMLCLTLPAQAAVNARVDKNPVLAGETVTLTIRSDAGDDEPDLSGLESDFQILGRSSSSQFQMINGRTTRSHDWIIQLRPKRLGELNIPAIPVGVERTAPIRLTVKKPDPATGQTAEAFIEFELDKSEVWLREQVIVSARLFVRGQLVSGSFSEPSSEHVVLEQLGEQTEHQALRGPHRYRVIERRYALFPEQSGTLTIAAPVFSGEVADAAQRSRGVFGYGTPTRSIYAAADPLSLSVRPPPDGQTVSGWLPAEDVQLSQTLEPADGPWQVGEPLTRTITLSVRGQLHTQLPALALKDPAGSQSYTEPAQGQTHSDGQTLMATQRYSSAIIPGPGDTLTLPAVELDWWDTNRDQRRTVTLPARRLALAGTPAAVSPSAPATPTPPVETTAMTPAPAVAVGVDWRWQLAALTCAAGWLGTLAAWLWQTRRRKPATTGRTTSRRDHPHIREVLRRDDARSCRQALLDWAGEHTGRRLQLQELADFSDDPALPAALAALDQAAFGNGRDFDRSALLRLVRDFRYPAPSSAQPHALAPLYPE